MAPLEVPLHPDRLVAFLRAVDQHSFASHGLDPSVKDLVDAATEANLTTATDLIVPAGFDPEEPWTDQEGGYAYGLHMFAFALTGVTARGRYAVSQLGLSDGQTAGLDGVLQPNRIAELVKRVADELAREAADAE